MPLAAIPYDWLKLLRILAAMIWVGGGVAVAVLAKQALRSREREAIACVTNLRVVGPLMFLPAMLAVLGPGIWLVLESDAREFGQTRVWLALTLFAATQVARELGHGLVRRAHEPDGLEAAGRAAWCVASGLPSWGRRPQSSGVHETEATPVQAGRSPRGAASATLRELQRPPGRASIELGSAGGCAMRSMTARPGDRVVVSGHRVGDAERTGEVLEALGPGGAPPYRVRWPDGRESSVYPGSDVRIEPRERPSRRGRARGG